MEGGSNLALGDEWAASHSDCFIPLETRLDEPIWTYETHPSHFYTQSYSSSIFMCVSYKMHKKVMKDKKANSGW